MATTYASKFIKIEGVQAAVRALQALEPAVRIRHMRIALMAAGGVIKKRIEATAPRDSGLLAKSIRVKSIIPQASKNPASHSHPASVFIGPGRGLVAVKSKRGNLSVRTYKSVAKKLAAAKAAGKAAPLSIVMSGRRILGQRILKPVAASRYAHFAEKGRKGKGATHFMDRAATSGAAEAQAKFAQKISQGIQQEAARLASKP